MGAGHALQLLLLPFCFTATQRSRRRAIFKKRQKRLKAQHSPRLRWFHAQKFVALRTATAQKVQDSNAMAKTGTQIPDVFEALCMAAAQELQDFNALNVANALWTMAKTGTQMPDVLEALCAEASTRVRDFNAQGLANTLWAMAKTGT